MLLFYFHFLYINHQLLRMLTFSLGHAALASAFYHYIMYEAIKCKCKTTYRNVNPAFVYFSVKRPNV